MPPSECPELACISAALSAALPFLFIVIDFEK
jgi:hypothetical protein